MSKLAKKPINQYLEQLVPLLHELESTPSFTKPEFQRLQKKYSKPEGGVFSKDFIIAGYRELAGSHGLQPFDAQVINKIKKKPTRTISGVTPVTVLTKPFPCPGKCIFCPNDIRMPKSYLSDEPGAQRAERNYFDPYLQTYNRLQALHNIGHQLDKVEIIVLGGTWSFYSESYQIWFIKECFRALNEFGKNDDREVIIARYQKMHKVYAKIQRYAPTNDPETNQEQSAEYAIDGTHLDKTYNQTVSNMYVAPEKLAGFDAYQSASWQELEEQQQQNESAKIRSVGLVVETRPDNISEAEVKRIRRLGCTKTQIGVQSLQDDVLKKNHRGHTVAATRRAFRLLRQAGFKIHAHWMANLYGSNPELDMTDYDILFNDPDFKPDELKVYPCSLIESAELMQYYKKGLWKPYSHEELLQVVSHTLLEAPRYCRLTRVIRDIPSTDIVDGNTFTNFRQIASDHIKKLGKSGVDIRSREIKNDWFDEKKIELKNTLYKTSTSTEIFLEYVAPDKQGRERILGFLRLSLPTTQSFIAELHDAAIIREIHVYGQVVGIGKSVKDRAQHLGLGTKLIGVASTIAQKKYQKLAVISAIGTKEYYRKKGFEDGELYQFKTLHPSQSALE